MEFAGRFEIIQLTLIIGKLISYFLGINNIVLKNRMNQVGNPGLLVRL